MSHLHEETSPNLAKKYLPQVSQLKELVPDWNDEDLSSVLQDTHGSVEVAFDRISQGQVQPWGAVNRKSKKPQPAGRDSPRPNAGRGQRGRGAPRGGHRGGPSQRGSHSRAAPFVPANGAGSEPSTSQAADSVVAPWTPALAPVQPAPSEPKTNGTPVPAATPAPASNGTQVHPAPAAPSRPTPAAMPGKSWASLLKPPPAPAPAPPLPMKQPLSAPAQPSASQPQAPLTTELAITEHPDDAPPAKAVAHPEPEPEESTAESDAVPEPEPVREPSPALEPVDEPTPVDEHFPPAQEQPKPESPTPAPTQPISPPAPAPPHHAPPGLNLVTQQAPAPDPLQAAPPTPPGAHQAAPVPAPVPQKPIAQHRPSARYPKSDQAVVMPSGFGDLVTGMRGLSFGQFGDPEVGPDDVQNPYVTVVVNHLHANSPSRPEQPHPQAHVPTVNIPTDAPPPTQVPIQAPPQEQHSVPPHLTISDQLPQAQDTRPIPTQNQHSQTPLLSHLAQAPQQVPPSAQSHFSPPVQPQSAPQSHFPAQMQAHLPQHQQVVSTQSPHIQNAQQQQQQQDQQQPLHPSHLVHTQVHEPFPQHALSGVNLYQQSSQSPFGQQPQPGQQPQQLHPVLRQSHMAQQQQQISPPAQQTQQPMLGTGLGSHYQPPHLELGVGSEYGAFGNLGQPAAANFGGGPERYGYDNSHSQQGGFYDSPYGLPSRGASTTDDINKGSPSQQPAPISQNTAPSQPQPQQQPGQSGQQQPYSGIAPIPYFYAPYYQNQYFGQPSPNYGQPFVKYPMYPQQSQQQSQQQPQQGQPQAQPQPPQAKAGSSLYEDQYGQGGYQPQSQQTPSSDYVKAQQQQQFGAQGGGLQSLLGGQARAPVASDMGLKGYTTAADKPRIGQQQAPYYAGSMRYPQHVPHQQGYQQQQPDNSYYQYAGRQQQPNQSYGQWQ
ncbi:RNAPII degradation factor [Ceratobasidium sp. 414]|nr:RNAPII degradation factor [Ceratobasidium sp. 414]